MTRPRAKLAGTLAACAVLLGVVGIIAVTHTREVATQERWISHSYRVKSMVNALSAQLGVLEMDHARAAFTAQDVTPERNAPSVVKIGNILRTLREVTSDNPSQQVRIIKLGRLIRARHAQLDTVIRAARARGIATHGLAGADTTLLDSINVLTTAMRAEEDSLLVGRVANSRKSVNAALVVLVLLTVTGCVAVGTAATGLLRENRRHRAAVVALAESDDRYRSLVADVQDVIFQTDADGRWVLLNPSWTRITGFAVADCIGRPAIEQVHPADAEKLLRSLGDLSSRAERNIAQPLRLLAHDGTVRWVQMHARAHHDENGRLFSMGGTLSDITARMQVEERQRRDDERMRQVMEDMPVAVAMFDRDLRYLFASHQWRVRYGLQKTEIEGRCHYDLVPDVGADARAVHRRALGGTIVRREEERVIRSDGTEDWFRWEVRPWLEQDGTVGGIIVTTERITERKRVEQERMARLEEQSTRALLEANEQRYRTVAEALPQIVFTARPDGCTDYFNQNWYAYTGLTQKQSLGWAWHAAVHPDDVARVTERWTKSCNDGGDFEVEYRFRRASDDVYRWHLGRAVAVRDDDSRIVKWIGTCTDIDDRKRAENALRQVREQLEVLVAVRTNELSRAVTDLQSEIAERARIEDALRVAKDSAEAANRAKSDFLARMSHELRTPLNSVIGFSNVLLKSKRANLANQDREYVERIASNGTHLLGLINDLLDLSKIEAGRGTLSLSPVDLGPLVASTLAQFDNQTHGRDVELIAHVPSGLLPIETDAQRIRQVLINLVGNALKFTAHGSVSVHVRADAATGRPTRIDVIDTGIGIPADRQQKIFEAFEQADVGTARRYGGTGLGLAISRALCQLMGYSLDLRSEPGAGSTFSIVIVKPLCAKTPQASLPALTASADAVLV
ncbi:MAG TPA: PAS domain S-box protein [Gemmatimonadaceae bacterium]